MGQAAGQMVLTAGYNNTSHTAGKCNNSLQTHQPLTSVIDQSVHRLIIPAN